MERALARHPSLAARLFTEEELSFCERRARPAEHLAAHFAARRAVLKALGCGFGSGIGRKSVSVGHGEGGRPVAVLEGRISELAAEQGVSEIALSLSVTREVATAMALLVTDEVRPKPKEGRDPQREMLASFKRARSVIDELERLQDGVAATLEHLPTHPGHDDQTASGDPVAMEG